MTSFGGLSLTTLMDSAPDVLPAAMVSGIPGGLLVRSARSARESQAMRTSRAQARASFLMRGLRMIADLVGCWGGTGHSRDEIGATGERRPGQCRRGERREE